MEKKKNFSTAAGSTYLPRSCLTCDQRREQKPEENRTGRGRRYCYSGGDDRTRCGGVVGYKRYAVIRCACTGIITIIVLPVAVSVGWWGGEHRAGAETDNGLHGTYHGTYLYPPTSLYHRTTTGSRRRHREWDNAAAAATAVLPYSARSVERIAQRRGDLSPPSRVVIILTIVIIIK